MRVDVTALASLVARASRKSPTLCKVDVRAWAGHMFWQLDIEFGRPAMAMAAGDIESLIKDGIPNATVTIEDLRGDGDHYLAVVVSDAFRGKSRVQQHQMVYDALQGRMGNELHALALQTSAPE